jgi:hypothetical protein
MVRDRCAAKRGLRKKGFNVLSPFYSSFGNESTIVSPFDTQGTSIKFVNSPHSHETIVTAVGRWSRTVGITGIWKVSMTCSEPMYGELLDVSQQTAKISK